MTQRPTNYVQRPVGPPVRNHAVAESWAKNHSAVNHRSTFHTDGTKLYSYNLMIGDTCPDTGVKVVKDYTAGGTYGFSSQTTSCHVGRVRYIPGYETILV
jgi:hypothetical protein